MISFKKMMAVVAVLAMFSFSAKDATAGEYATNTGGCGYTECCDAPCLAPAIALGTIALVAIIAVAVQNHSKSHHGHSHNSCSSSSSN